MVILLHQSPKHWDNRCELLAFSDPEVDRGRQLGEGYVFLKIQGPCLDPSISGAVRVGYVGTLCCDSTA